MSQRQSFGSSLSTIGTTNTSATMIAIAPAVCRTSAPTP